MLTCIQFGANMEISKEQFFTNAANLGIANDQAKALWTSFETNESKASSFSKLLFYFGALIIISAMTWFMNLSWQWFGGGGIFLIAIAYALLFTFLGAKLWKKAELKIPAGLFITIAVCMVPLAIYGLQEYFNLWPTGDAENYKDFYYLIKGNWIFMEIGTILAGLIAIRYFPFPFLTAPIFFAAWFLTMDIIPLLIGEESQSRQREWISLLFGLGLLLIAYLIDRKKLREDYAFWGYFFGTFIFWGSISSLIWNTSEPVFFIYLLINILLMALSILLKRKVLMVFGAIGTFLYFSHLAYDIFQNSMLFPFILSFIGLLIIYLGVLYQKNIAWIEKAILEKMPDSIKHLLP